MWVVLPLEGQDGINRKQPFDCVKVRITGKLFPKFGMERWEQSSFGGWSSFEGPDVVLWVYVPGILWKSKFSYVAQSYAPYSVCERGAPGFLYNSVYVRSEARCDVNDDMNSL